MRRAPRRGEGRDQTCQCRQQYGLRHEHGIHWYVEQLWTEVVEYLHETPANRRTQQGAPAAQQRALQQEYALDLTALAAHGAQDADLARALYHTDGQHAGNAEGHRDTDEDADHLRGQGLRAQRVEQFTIGCHPALRLQLGAASELLCDVLGLEQFRHCGVDHRDATGEVQQGLRLAQIKIDPAFVQLTLAQVEDAADLQQCLAAVAAVEAQLVTHGQSQ